MGSTAPVRITERTAKPSDGDVGLDQMLLDREHDIRHGALVSGFPYTDSNFSQSRTIRARTHLPSSGPSGHLLPEGEGLACCVCARSP